MHKKKKKKKILRVSWLFLCVSVIQLLVLCKNTFTYKAPCVYGAEQSVNVAISAFILPFWESYGPSPMLTTSNLLRQCLPFFVGLALHSQDGLLPKWEWYKQGFIFVKLPIHDSVFVFVFLFSQVAEAKNVISSPSTHFGVHAGIPPLCHCILKAGRLPRLPVIRIHSLTLRPIGCNAA